MQPKYAVRIENPCHEAWEEFSASPGGRWCPFCRHQVVDFTRLSDEEIIRYLDTHKGKTCARLLPAQVKVYQESLSNRAIGSPRLPFVVAGMVGALLTMSAPAEAQEKKKASTVDTVAQSGKTGAAGRLTTVKGIVTSKVEGIPLPGTNVVVKGTIVGTICDKWGRFTLTKPINKGDVIVFSFIGYQAVEYVVQDSLDIDLAVELTEGQLLEGPIYVMGALNVDELYTADKRKESLWGRVLNMFTPSKRHLSTGRTNSDFLE